MNAKPPAVTIGPPILIDPHSVFAAGGDILPKITMRKLSDELELRLFATICILHERRLTQHIRSVGSA
jgi:hypothetical protein